MTSIAACARASKNNQSIEDWLSGVILEKSPYPIFITLQANIGWGPGNSDRVLRKFRELLYILDRNRRKIKRPELLPARDRFEGIAVMENAEDNPHIHFIVFSNSALDRKLKFMFLLEYLNDTWKQDCQSEHYNCLRSWNDRAGIITKSKDFSLWKQKFPSGTADVRIIDDIPGIVRYVTTEMRGRKVSSSSEINALKLGKFDNIHFVQYEDPKPNSRARNFIYDPANPRRKILNLDKPTWRNSFGRIR